MSTCLKPAVSSLEGNRFGSYTRYSLEELVPIREPRVPAKTERAWDAAQYEQTCESV
jgi:hypothetical protein